jgi:hypothetical protein
MEITIEVICDVTEYATLPPEKNQKVVFSINNKSVVISATETNTDIILYQTEISIQDAKDLASTILNGF